MVNACWAVRHLGHGELGEHLLALARRANRSHDYDLSFAVLDDRAPAGEVAGGVLTPFDAMGHRGPVVATCLRTALFVGRLAAPVRPCFYWWDLDWARAPFDHAELVAAVRRGPNWARTPAHADAVRRAFGVEAGVARYPEAVLAAL